MTRNGCLRVLCNLFIHHYFRYIVRIIEVNVDNWNIFQLPFQAIECSLKSLTGNRASLFKHIILFHLTYISDLSELT